MNTKSKSLITKKSKSPFEIVYGVTLNTIYVLNILFGLKRFSTDKKLVLCYHSIGNNSWRFATTPDDFKEQIDFLLKRYSIVKLNSLFKRSIKGVSITFDDGYLDVMRNALPIMNNKRIKATMFVLGDNMNPNRKAMDNRLTLLTLDQVKELKKSGWEIGYHSKTHSDLISLDSKQLYEEIVQSKKQLEKSSSIKMKYFAYPKGYYSEKVYEFVERAGYKAAFNADGSAMKLDDYFCLNRIPLEGGVNIEQFEAMLSPLGLFVTEKFMKILKLKEHWTLKINKSLVEMRMYVKFYRTNSPTLQEMLDFSNTKGKKYE